MNLKARCFAALCAFALFVPRSISAEDASLQALPSSDGIVSWWLLSPVQKEPIAQAVPPKDAKEGAAVRADADGKWKLHVSPARFSDCRPLIGSANQGTLWASCRIKGDGGPRRLRAGTFSALRVFLDGKEVLSKPEPTQPYSDEAEAEITLPKGECELTVAFNIRYGYAGFQLNLTEGKALGGLPKAVANDTVVLPFAEGHKPEPQNAALESFTFISREPLVNPGQKTAVMIALAGSLPTGLDLLSGQFVMPDGAPITEKFPERKPAELNNRGAWQFEFVVPQTDELRQTLHLRITSGGKPLGIKKLDLYSLKGFGKAAKALTAGLAARQKAANRRFAHAALAQEKLALLTQRIEGGEERVSPDTGQQLLKLLDDAKSFAALEEQGKDPFAEKSGYIERAYISNIDDAVQPYFAYVPAKLEDKTPKPLVVFLHGYVPSYDKHRWWDEVPELNQNLEKHGAFLAIPFGRSNTDFQSCGEVDVLDVIADMKARYPIDPQRIYLYGYSMGGMAAYHLGAHHPDLFAAAIVIAGRADSPLQNKAPLDKFHPYKQWLIQADNPISLCENLLNIPVRIYHGNQDFIIDIAEARRMEKRIKEIGGTAQLFEVKGDHFFGFELLTKEEPLSWLLSQKRADTPAQRWMKQYSLKFASQGALKAVATTGALEALEAKWVEKEGKPEIAAKSASVLALEIKNTPPPVVADLQKTPQRCGPVRDAITRPFLIVYGTIGALEKNALNKQNAEQFANEWFLFTRSRALIKADKDVTDDEKKTKNLFLFGEEQDNALHAAAAPSLPIKVKDGIVTVGAKTAPLKDRGVIHTYPSPFAPKDGSQLIVVCAGLLYGQHIGVNHKLDLLPDFLLFTPEADVDGTGTNKFILAGFYDGMWKLSEKTTWWQE